MVFGRNRGLGELTINYRAEQGKKLFGTGVFLFGDGLIWFRSPGIFTLLPFSDTHRFFNIFFRASIVIGVILAAYGMLVWRSTFRKLSLANYIIVLSCAPVLPPMRIQDDRMGLLFRSAERVFDFE